ncbi:hypothetical protein OC845_003393 [Tilletia horrida]|nr:hypothetical protein OC845_003393 [Tilletia horrida]
MSKRTRIPAAPRSAMPEPITGPPAPSYSASQERGPTLKKAHTTAEQRAQVEHLQRTPLSDNLIDSFLRENPTNVTRFTLRAFHCDQHNTPPHRPYWPNDHYGLGPRALELHIKLWKRRPKIILHNNRPHSAPSISSTSTTAQQPNSAHSPEQSSTATADQLGSIDIVQNWVQVAVAYAWLKDRRKKGRELGAKGIPPWSITPRPRNLGIARLLDLHKLTRKAVVEIVRKDVWADETNGCQTLVKFALSHKSCSYFCGIDTIHGPGGLNVWSTLYLDPKTPDPTPEKAQSSSSNQNRQASQAASGQAGPKTVKVLVRKGRKRSLFSRGSLRDYLTAQTDKFQQSASGGGSRSSEAIPEPDFEIIEEEDEDEMEESDEEREDDDDEEEEDEDDGVRRPGQRSQGSSQPGSQRDRSRSNTGKGRRRPKMPPPDRIMLALKSKSDAHDLQEILKPFLHVHFLAEYRQIERAFDAELDRLREASVDVESYIRQAVKLDEASPGLEAQKLINLLPKNLSLPSAGSGAKTQPLEVAHDSDGDIVCLPDNPSAERERKRRIQKRKDDRAAARARGRRASDEEEEGEEDEIYCSSDTDPIGRSLEHTAQKNRQKRSSNQGGASHSLETSSQSRSSSPTARFNTASQGQLLGNGEEKGKKRQHRNVLAQMTTQLVQSGRLSGHADYHGDDSGGARSEAGPSSRPIHRIRSILEDDDYDEVENVRPAHRVVPSQASSRSQHGSSPLAQQQLQQSQPIRRQYEGRAGQIAIPAFLQSELAKAHGGGLRSVTYNFGDMDLDQLDDAVEGEHVSDGGEYEEDDKRLEGSESDDDGDDNDFARVERAGKKRVRGRRRKKNGKAARGGGGSANVRNRAPARDEDGFERLSDDVDSADEAVRQVQEFMERERREQAEAEAEAKANAKAAEEAAGKKLVAQKEQALGAVESGSFYGAKAAHGGGAARMAPKSTATAAAAAAGASLSNGHAGSAESSALTNGTGPDAEDKENRRPAAAARTTMVVDDDGHMVVAGGDVGAAAAVMKDAHWIASTLVTPQAASLPVLAASTAHSSPAAKTPRIGAGAGRKRKRPEVDAVRPASEGNESRGEETPSLLLLPHHADNPEREGGVNGRARRSNAGVPSAALRADYQLSSPKLTKSSGSRGEAVKTSPYFQANDAASTGNHAATTHDEEDDDAVLVILPPGSDSSVKPAFRQRSNGAVPNGMLASTSPHQSSRAAAADPVPASPAKGTPRAADTEETRDAGDDSDELQELMAQQR